MSNDPLSGPSEKVWGGLEVVPLTSSDSDLYLEYIYICMHLHTQYVSSCLCDATHCQLFCGMTFLKLYVQILVYLHYNDCQMMGTSNLGWT